VTWKHRLRAAVQKLLGLNLTNLRIEGMEAQLALLQKELELTRRDLLGALAWPLPTSVVLKSSAGPALHSVDHIVPKGTVRDNTRWPRLAVWAEELFGRKIRALDLGCAGGGLVFDMVSAGHDAVGVEGSDLSARFSRAEWGTIRDRLFVADITVEFQLWDDAAGAPAGFDLVTAWEVLEHIPEDLLPGLFGNVLRHLNKGGIFAASVATYEDVDGATGLRWHQTVQPKSWWLGTIGRVAPGLVEVAGGWATKDFPRGSGNPNIPWDWDADADPGRGFHLVLRRA
jgi:SAM-dependent methyltransferase